VLQLECDDVAFALEIQWFRRYPHSSNCGGMSLLARPVQSVDTHMARAHYDVLAASPHANLAMCPSNTNRHAVFVNQNLYTLCARLVYPIPSDIVSFKRVLAYATITTVAIKPVENSLSANHFTSSN
jgi:hypothetical protein